MVFDSRPVLVFDGDCAFCRLWIDYWQTLTGDRVEYLPYQKAASRYPEVPKSDFQKAVHLFKDGKTYSGADAVFQLDATQPGPDWRLWIFYHVPGFAALARWVYGLIAAHRNAGYTITRLFWGKRVQPATYKRAAALFVRAMALVYMIAFISFGRQARGLIGAQGIQPITEFLSQVTRQFGSSAFWVVPTLFWWTHSEFALESIVWGGALLGFVAAVGRPHTAGQRAALVVLFVYYLSVVNAGQIFMGYQWDYLLLEAGFLAIFLKPVRTRIFLFHWLVFRLIFESGAVKLLSHDVSWRNLTALAVHYQTQPLPTPLAWYMMQLPLWFQKVSTGFVLTVELAVPFLIFGPRRLKQIAGAAIILLQLLILLTGNYTFFNLLTIVLCLFLFDDQFLSREKKAESEPKVVKPAVTRAPPSRRRYGPVTLTSNRYVSAVLFIVVMTLSVTELLGMFGVGTTSPFSTLATRMSALGIVNQYGLFANMTTTRPELSIEGSNDGVDWQPYVFKYKPGPLNRAPAWVAPNQPRLDWQMWFAALGNYRENPWVIRFMQRLLEGSVPVLELVDQNPFAGKPPKYVRAVRYEYQFTTYDERRKTGNWWKRELKGPYFPPISLRADPKPEHNN
jgi:predicted DCC family thiol-disulfide oxidoreductase YuxK